MPREHCDKSAKNEMESALAFLQRKFRERWRLSDHELQFRNEIHDELAVRTQRITKGCTPFAQFRFALAQKETDKVLEGLRQRGIRDVALVLIELAGGEKATRRNELLVQLVDDRRLADSGIAGDEDQFGDAAVDDAIE